MKKIVLSAVILAGISFTSCEPWEDETYQEAAPGEEIITMEGTWKLTELTLEEALDLNGDGNASTSLMNETNCYQNELITFNPDFTGIATSNSYAEITIEGETFTVECITEVDETTFVWNHTGNNITLNFGGTNLIATQTGNTITYTLPDGFSAYEGTENGAEIIQDLKFVYTKQ